MNSNLTLEQRRQRIETIVKLGLLGVVAFLVSPFILAVVKGLAGMVLAGAFALVVVNLAPAFAALVANWRLKALKAVAAANPIETLENDYSSKMNALNERRENIKKTICVKDSLKSMIDDYNTQYPNTPSPYLEKYKKLESAIDQQCANYKKAKANLAKYADLIVQKRADWAIAQRMAEVSKLANVGEDFQSKLMKDTALSTVQDGLNMAFSELDTSLLEADSATPAPSAPSATTVSVAPAVHPRLADKVADTDVLDEAVPELEPVPVARNRNR